MSFRDAASVRLAAAVLFAISVTTAAAEEKPTSVDAATAVNMVGKSIVLVDTVSEVQETGAGAIFLNFGGTYPNEIFRAVVLPGTRARFGEISIKSGDTVRITGDVTDYEGFPRIVLRNSDQLSVVAEPR